jgi:NAD(P)-dependent dehydrogenase (short-subunit alcohol dehydrogenase family)
VNNAGILNAALLDQMSEDVWDGMMATKVVARRATAVVKADQEGA